MMGIDYSSANFGCILCQHPPRRLQIQNDKWFLFDEAALLIAFMFSQYLFWRLLEIITSPLVLSHRTLAFWEEEPTNRKKLGCQPPHLLNIICLMVIMHYINCMIRWLWHTCWPAQWLQMSGARTSTTMKASQERVRSQWYSTSLCNIG